MNAPRIIVQVFSAILLIAAAAPARGGRTFDHGPFDRLLGKHVKRGRVDYAGIKNDRSRSAELGRYVKALGAASLSGMSKRDKLAFYLNAYNALVIDAVVRRWPRIDSVMKVKGFFDKITYRVAGRRVTLNQLENKIIRPTFKDARIHFALVCGARSCPPLMSKAFDGASLDKVLERLTRDFINSKKGVLVGPGGRVRVSQIFKWYAADFEKAAGSVPKYLARYHTKQTDRITKAGRLVYLHYSWSLNN
jgi:hypothetical protein